MKFITVLFLTAATASGKSLRSEDPGRQLQDEWIQPALIHKELNEECLVFSPDGDNMEVIPVTEGNIIVSEKQGGIVTTCHGVIPNETGQKKLISAEYPDLQCATYIELERSRCSRMIHTNNWVENIAASGQVFLKCTFNLDD